MCLWKTFQLVRVCCVVFPLSLRRKSERGKAIKGTDKNTMVLPCFLNKYHDNNSLKWATLDRDNVLHKSTVVVPLYSDLIRG